MKKILIISLLALISLAAFSQSEKSNFKKYPFKSVIIEYKVEGKTTGTKTVYIDDYGYREATYSNTTTKMMGMKTEENKADIIIGNTIYLVDFNSGQAHSTVSPIADYLASQGSDWEEVGKNILEQLGYEKTANESVNGKDCEVWEGMNKIWIWKGLLMKSETSMMGMKFTEIFTDIKINATIPNAKFEVPDDFDVQENDMGGDMQNLMQNFQKEMKDVKKNNNMVSYEQFRASVLADDPDTKEADIKKSYELYKAMLK